MKTILITCTTLLLTLSLMSCQQENSLLCDNGYLNSAGDNVDNCDCPPGYRPRIKLPFDDWMPRSWNGVNCIKEPATSGQRVLPVYTKEQIGHPLIEKGQLIYNDHYWAFIADISDEWSVFSGPHSHAYITLIELPNYNYLDVNSFFVRSLHQWTITISRDSVQIDLRTLPNGYGYTDKGEGIFIAFRVDRYSHPTETLFFNPMIHLTAPGDDISLDPIRSIPIEPLF